MKTLEPLIADHPFFKNLDKSYLELIVGCASNVKFAAGDFIFREGDAANQFFIVRQGKVVIESCAPGREPISLQTFSDGDILGWSWLVPPYHWQFDAQAVELTRAITFRQGPGSRPNAITGRLRRSTTTIENTHGRIQPDDS